MSDLTPWIVTVQLPDSDQILFRTPPAAQVGFHRAAEISGDNESTYAGDLIITADTVQIARLSDWVGGYAAPAEDDVIDVEILDDDSLEPLDEQEAEREWKTIRVMTTVDTADIRRWAEKLSDAHEAGVAQVLWDALGHLEAGTYRQPGARESVAVGADDE